MELVPGYWVRDAAVWVSDDFIEADNARRCRTFHELRYVAIHVVVNMVVVSWGDAISSRVENSGIERVSDGNSEIGAFGRGGGGFELDRG